MDIPVVDVFRYWTLSLINNYSSCLCDTGAREPWANGDHRPDERGPAASRTPTQGFGPIERESPTRGMGICVHYFDPRTDTTPVCDADDCGDAVMPSAGRLMPVEA